MARVFAVTYGAGHVKMVVPVVRELSARHCDVTVLAATTAGPEMRAAGMPHIGYLDLLEQGDEDALELGRAILVDSHAPGSGISEEESTAYLGLNLRDVLRKHGEQPGWELYREWGRHSFLPLHTMRRALKRYRPDVVLVTSSPKSERAAQIVARELGIPSVQIEDNDGRNGPYIPPWVPWSDAEILCAPSAISAAAMARRDPPVRGEIRLTGNPAFDRMAPWLEISPYEAKRRIGADPDRLLLLLLHQTFYDMSVLGATLADSIDHDARLQVGIRLHPGVAVAKAPPAVPAWMLPLTAPALEDVLLAADVVATSTSTAGDQALLLRRPLLQLASEVVGDERRQLSLDGKPFWKHGASILVERPEDLGAAVARALDPVGRAALVTRGGDVFPPVGEAAGKVADAVLELARQGAAGT